MRASGWWLGERQGQSQGQRLPPAGPPSERDQARVPWVRALCWPVGVRGGGVGDVALSSAGHRRRIRNLTDRSSGGGFGLCAACVSPLARPVRTLIRAAPARPRRGPHPQARVLRKIPWPGPLPPSPACCKISHHPDLMGNPTSPNHPHGKCSHCIQRAASSSSSHHFS